MTATDSDGTAVGGAVREQIVELADRQLEPGYFSKRTPYDSAATALERRVRAPESDLLVYLATEGVRVVTDPTTLERPLDMQGFALYGTASKVDLNEYMTVPVKDVFPDLEFPVGHFRNVTLRDGVDDWRVGGALMRRAVSRLAEWGHDTMVTLAWEPDHRRSVGHAVEAFDGRKVATFEDYFEDRMCPACGFSTDCTCTFAFYRLELDGYFDRPV